MEFSEKVERELDALEQSAVAYVRAGAREEGQVMGVVDSLRAHSREICEQVGEWDTVLCVCVGVGVCVPACGLCSVQCVIRAMSEWGQFMFDLTSHHFTCVDYVVCLG